jgi:hypothetical protein
VRLAGSRDPGDAVFPERSGGCDGKYASLK